MHPNSTADIRGVTSSCKGRKASPGDGTERSALRERGKALTASISVNCSATMMGSKDRKLKAGSSSSKPLSSCVAKGQPMCSPEESRQRKNHLTTLPGLGQNFLWLRLMSNLSTPMLLLPPAPLSPTKPTCPLASMTCRLTVSELFIIINRGQSDCL